MEYGFDRFLRYDELNEWLDGVAAAHPDLVSIETYGTSSVQLTYTDGSEQTIDTGGMRVVELLDEVERVARWKGSDVQNPFDRLREARRKQLGL